MITSSVARAVARAVPRAPLQGRFGVAYPLDAILHFDADIDAYAEQTGGPHTFNHAVLSPQYQRNSDGSYSNVGAKPAVDVFDGEKWLRSCGAVTNLLTNSVFAGAVSGTPGIAPTGWTNFGGAGQWVVNGSSITTIANNNRAHFGITSPALNANTVHRLCVDAITDGNLVVGHFIWATTVPTGATFTFEVDGVARADSYLVPAGTHKVCLVISIRATAGTIGVRLGAGVTDNTTGTVTISNPQLTATAYPLPYVPTTASGPVTQPASNATTTGGSWFSLPDGSPLWKALDGQPDGVELAQSPNFEVPAHWDTSQGWSVSVGLATLVPGASTGSVLQSFGVIGARYKITYTITAISAVGMKARFGSAYGATRTTPGTYTDIGTQTSTTYIGISGENASSAGTVTNISIQRIAPQPLTLATRVMMGVGSGDIATATTDALVASVSGTDAGRFIHMFRGGVGEANVRIMQAADGTLFPFFAGVPWQRNAIIRRVTQVNTAGTQFRVGYMIEGTHTAIQWGSWVAFDGSFNPSTLYRLMIGYNNAYPMWFNKITAWGKQCTDAELLEAWS